METLSFIAKRYKIDLDGAPSPIKIPASRWRDMGPLLNDLNFKKGVEIGVYRGKFTACIAKSAPNLSLTGVDAWKVYKGYDEYQANDLENKAYLEAKAETEKYNVKLIKAWSLDAALQFEDESLDFVFIDANHDYEHVSEDIAAWSKKVRKGGIVSGHDYIKSQRFDFDVIRAVDDWCSANDIKHLFLWKDQCPSWMYVKN
jgi:predicted O-methyltransferase YrrM